MTIPAKLGIGAVLAAVGLAGLVYTMPVISGGLSSKGLVFKEADVPAYQSSVTPYIAIEIASAAVMTGGIVLCTWGYPERFADVTLPLHGDKNSKANGSNKEKTNTEAEA